MRWKKNYDEKLFLLYTTLFNLAVEQVVLKRFSVADSSIGLDEIRHVEEELVYEYLLPIYFWVLVNYAILG